MVPRPTATPRPPDEDGLYFLTYMADDGIFADRPGLAPSREERPVPFALYHDSVGEMQKNRTRQAFLPFLAAPAFFLCSIVVSIPFLLLLGEAWADIYGFLLLFAVILLLSFLNR